MNSITAVLFALVLIVVILLIVWLVLRSRSDLPQGTASQGPGEGAPPSRPAVLDPASDQDQERPRAAAAGVAEKPADPDSPAAAEQPHADAAPAAAEEYVDSGLDATTEESSEDPGSVDGSGSSPRTPTEAFGEAGPAAASGVDDRQTSVLDDSNVDSTPLFRSIREERLGAAESTDPEGEDGSWSDERRRWDEQAHPRPDESTEEDQNMTPEKTGWVDEIANADGPAEFSMPRISELHEVTDGGFGIGSAAPLADGAQPMGHPIKANVDTKTYQDLHSPWYDRTEPDVWFLDPGFAERAGFHRAE